jgi:DNA topoisomerase-1
MEGLTAKVFRTYNASITLEKELEKCDIDDSMTVDEKMLVYNRANREVAILCNHQRTVSKSHETQMGKIDDKIKELHAEKKALKRRLEDIKAGRKLRDPDDDEVDENGKKKKKLPDEPDKIKKAISRIDDRISKWDTKKTEKVCKPILACF